MVSQWLVMCFPTSKEDLTYGVISYVPCLRLYQPDVSRDVSGELQSVTIVQYYQVVNTNLSVSCLDNISDKQLYGLFEFSFILVVLCSDMLLCLSLCTFYVLYSMCLHMSLHNIVFMACSHWWWTPDSITHCFIWHKYLYKCYGAGYWILALYKGTIIIIIYPTLHPFLNLLPNGLVPLEVDQSFLPNKSGTILVVFLCLPFLRYIQ